MTPTSQDSAPSSTEGLPGPDQIAELRQEIDWLDGEILRLVKRRTEISKIIGAVRLANGGPKLVLNRENTVISRYKELGKEGQQLAMALLSLGRGPLGR
jgi:chorismate mutase